MTTTHVQVRARVNTVKFENKWLREETLVVRSWFETSTVGLVERLAMVSDRLISWGRDLAMHFKSSLNECKRQIESLRMRDDAELVKELSIVKKNLTLC